MNNSLKATSCNHRPEITEHTGPRMVKAGLVAACNDCPASGLQLAPQSLVSESAPVSQLSAAVEARLNPHRLFNWVTAALLAVWIGLFVLVAGTVPSVETRSTQDQSAFIKSWL